ncbi:MULTISPECIES: translation initiation factor IF-3 [unclassified Paenibacillus]|uniref:translation initiation factor IF-3 n=1 Tax=unclassified Paenibacillus TaxID=185978 RepID=UPI002404EEF8|nr:MULTISPECIES: translation initiation factor IF-3 [unclassified Paenibacillus]MDF9842485.1 translation initiation factor IF-3 [Paenibacillus sp. PastF-2]MDF9849075.1 translation initiation factor IF-3 [Paenibacillus sp. PastM-2]MDF9855645.1 translation initiation factor IF-3 [Paenibacillus sp. PastF-1]MDH6480917.1 translation initiation factor IF-3 [Paenibacillus sp. PastH-2]MDH6508339.1 translation initiation factor IF-3 [Paenibacillus sp. PastM-3]
MAVFMNEQIRASEVVLTGLRGEKLGIVSREEALALARSQGADLVCTSLMSSPPPCTLMPKGKAKAAAQKEAASARKAGSGQAAGRSGGKDKVKVKELRFTAHIEEHDYDTKLRQADKHLRSGKPVLLNVQASGAKEAAAAKTVMERLVADLKEAGVKDTGIQSGGKGSKVQLNPR